MANVSSEIGLYTIGNEAELRGDKRAMYSLLASAPGTLVVLLRPCALLRRHGRDR